MTINKIDHITINLLDVKKSLYFYGILLGFKALPSIDTGDSVIYYFQLPNHTKLELIDYRFKTEKSHYSITDKGLGRHIAFEVDNAFEWEKKLTKEGYPFHEAVAFHKAFCCNGGLVKDPNGYELELVSR